jgi:predicted ATPase
LAIQVAADLLPRYRDGAWLVELAAVRDPDAVEGAVAAAFRLTNLGGKPFDDSLVEMPANSRCCWCWTTASIWWERWLGW